ncbi:hypothetical protein BDY21DRAFT_358415 [Lineolata rhizophorae]|uniref:Uncharacterized protein n=1 Tax=Lineolata rhizophorae TaxID=578093 RepID=A0A6A6NLT3_9PEZI|nr:hypothetical protein BDY21DRAFT_358415 [Lineolata rhizophorae]
MYVDLRVFAFEQVLIRMQFEQWTYTFDNDFALEFFKSLSSSRPPIQLAPARCCFRCTSIVAANRSLNLSNVSVAGKNCQVCALLLRAVKRHCNDDERNVQIIRRWPDSKIRSDGRQTLRICSDSGYCLQLTRAGQCRY